MNDALQRLGMLPGMGEIKKQVKQIILFHRMSDMRRQNGLKTLPQSNHMVFTGNPGTGKTTAARLVGEAFASLGLLKTAPPKDGTRNNTKKSEKIPFVEIHHADITSRYVGKAEQNIKEKFKQARGGVLFIDEAYAFIGDDGSTHKTGEKVIAAIVQLMEDMRDEIMVIAAGYSKEMNSFLDSNPGLRSRFNNSVHFPDYSVPDMVVIAQQMLADRDYQATSDYLRLLSNRLWQEKEKKGFGNARTVRNIIEQSIRSHSVRVSQLEKVSRDDLVFVTDLDIELEGQKAMEEKDMLTKAFNQIKGRLLELELQEITSRKTFE